MGQPFFWIAVVGMTPLVPLMVISPPVAISARLTWPVILVETIQVMETVTLIDFILQKLLQFSVKWL